MKLDRVLFVQLKMLGDILMLTPAIRAFKKKYPDALLDVAVESPGDDLLRYNPNVNEIVTLKSKRWYNLAAQLKFISNLRRNKYDMVIDFLGNPRSSHYSFLTGAPVRIGYNDAQYRYAYTQTYERKFNYSAYSKLDFLKFLGIDSENVSLDYNLPEHVRLPYEFSALSQQPIVAISPVSLRDDKIWPIENFVRIAEFLYAKFRLYPVVIVGPGELRYLDNFKRLAKSPYLPLYIDNLYVLGAVLKRCRMFIGNDNGPKHIAVAMGLPTYAVFSHKSDPVGWTCPDPVRHRYSGGKNRPDCAPIAEIKYKDVIPRISRMISELGIANLEKTSEKNIRE